MPKETPRIQLPHRHPPHDEWKANSLRLASRVRELEALVRRAEGLVSYAVDVPYRELEAQQWLDDASRAFRRGRSDA